MELINLTEKGCEIYRSLDTAANDSVKETLAHLEDYKLYGLVKNMDSIYNILSNNAERIIPTSNYIHPIVMRRIEEEDNIAIARVLRASVEEHGAPKVGTFYDDPHTDAMYQTFEQKGAEYWVIEYDGIILGGGGFYPTKGLPTGYAELSKFHFNPQVRGIGVGRLLLKKIEDRAIKAGYAHLYLVSYHQFSTAVSMYEKLGYKHISQTLDQSGLYQDAPFHMIKDL